MIEQTIFILRIRKKNKQNKQRKIMVEKTYTHMHTHTDLVYQYQIKGLKAKALMRIKRALFLYLEETAVMINVIINSVISRYNINVIIREKNKLLSS